MTTKTTRPLAADATVSSVPDDPARAAYRRLLDRHATTADRRVRWELLMAAHVVGQRVFALHWDSHVRMLGLAWEARDGREVAGQLLRLALTPVGHALGRLPAGNVGRATVPALQPMEPPAAVRAWIAWAEEGVGTP